MKKFLLTLAVVLTAVGASAQRFAPIQFNGKVSVQKEAAATPNVKKAPAKADLATDQRLIGYYTSDDASTQGLSISDYCTGTIMPAALLEKSLDYAQYTGAKVVGVRFYLPQGTATGVVIYDASGQYLQEIVSKDETVSTTGWNTVLLDEADQFTLTDELSALLVGTKLTQTSTNAPIGYNPNLSGFPMYIYANIPSSAGGQGEGIYNFGTDYTLTIQLLLEGEFPTNGAIPSDFGTYTVALNGTKDRTVTLYNAGTSLTSFAYTITQEGKTSEEKTVTLPATSQLGMGGSTTVTIPFPAASEVGIWPVTLTITKVNGNANELTTTGSGTNKTLSKALPKASVVEEATGTGCGYCPRGHVGMAKLRDKFGDQFVGIAIHRYNSSDAMFNNNYASIIPQGSAPVAFINRGDQIDPFHGSTSSGNLTVLEDFAATLEDLPEVGVNVSGQWNSDSTKVDVTANVESLIGGTYEMVYVLVADSLTGTTSAWLQANYFDSSLISQTSYSSKQVLSANYPELLFLYSKGTTYETYYNDVMIGSSYSSKTNKADKLTIAKGETAKGSYTISMPTKATLKNAINKKDVYCVALVIDTETNQVVNAAKNTIKAYDPTTGIDSVESTDATVVARYNAAGQMIAAPQKGLNIVKMSDGTTRKYMVK